MACLECLGEVMHHPVLDNVFNQDSVLGVGTKPVLIGITGSLRESPRTNDVHVTGKLLSQKMGT